MWSIYTLLSFIVLAAVIVVVHEAGHLIAAALFGVRVTRVALGMGPVALRTFTGPADAQTEWRIGWIPLGGHIRLLGDGGEEPAKPSPETQRPAPGRRRLDTLANRPLWQQWTILLAGPAFNLLLPLPLFFLSYLREERQVAAVIADLSPGLPAAEAGLLPGDRVVAIDGKPLQTFEELRERIGRAPGATLRVTVDRSGRFGAALRAATQGSTSSPSGRSSELINRFVTPQAHVAARRGTPDEVVGVIGISERARIPQIGVEPGSPAARAGLRTGDIVLSVAGIPVASWPELEQLLARSGAAVLPIAYLSFASGTSGDAAVASALGATVLAPRLALVAPELASPLGTAGAPSTGGKASAVGTPAASGKASAVGTASAGGTGGSVATERRYVTGIAPGERFVREVLRGSPADELGLRPGDEILRFEGEPVVRWLRVEQLLASAAEGAGRGRELAVEWRSGDGAMHRGRFRQQSRWFVDEMGLPRRRPIFGVRTYRLLAPVEELTQPPSLGYAARRAVELSVSSVSRLGSGLLELLSGSRSADQLGGPFTMALLAEGATRRGVNQLVELIALVSINLGLLNLLPIPPLDGGQMAISLAELGLQRPLRPKLRRAIWLGGIALIALLVLVALRNDFTRLLPHTEPSL